MCPKYSRTNLLFLRFDRKKEKLRLSIRCRFSFSLRASSSLRNRTVYICESRGSVMAGKTVPGDCATLSEDFGQSSSPSPDLFILNGISECIAE